MSQSQANKAQNVGNVDMTMDINAMEQQAQNIFEKWIRTKKPKPGAEEFIFDT